MVRTVYSSYGRWRYHQVGIASVLLMSLATACGGPPKSPNAPKASPSVLALLDQAQEAERARDYATARAFYQQAIDEAPNAHSAALATREMASALVFWGEYAAAETYLETSLSHDAGQARVWHDLALVQQHNKKPERALVSLERALVLAPKEPRVRVAYAALLVTQKRYADAIVQYEFLLTLHIPPRIENATHKALQMLRNELARGT